MEAREVNNLLLGNAHDSLRLAEYYINQGAKKWRDWAKNTQSQVPNDAFGGAFEEIAIAKKNLLNCRNYTRSVVVSDILDAVRVAYGVPDFDFSKRSRKRPIPDMKKVATLLIKDTLAEGVTLVQLSAMIDNCDHSTALYRLDRGKLSWNAESRLDEAREILNERG